MLDLSSDGAGKKLNANIKANVAIVLSISHCFEHKDNVFLYNLSKFSQTFNKTA